MKKLLCAVLICALCACALTGCGDRPPAAGVNGPRPTVSAVPEEGSHGEVDQSQVLAGMPTLAPVEAIDGGYVDDDEYVDDDDDDDYYSIDALINPAVADETPEPAPQATERPGGNIIDPNTMSFNALNDPDMKLTFNYPSNWINVPGIYTVCYREMAEPGEFPARVAISGKRLVHSPEGTVVTDELTEFVRVIRKQYDSNTFQLGTLNAEDTFLEKQAYSNTYLAYSGETEVKGFITGCAIGRVLYVFHFCASYDDYTALERVMRYMLNSVRILQEEKKA